MAKHEIMIHENTSATKESAPYLGSYISKETLKTDEFAAKIAEKCGLPAIQVQAIIAGAFDAIEDLEKEELVRLHVDGLTVCGVITGSFPTADAKFDPEKNALQLAVRLDEGIRNALADVTPAVITDASLTHLRIDNLADLEVQRPQNLVHGQHVFREAGFCMVLSDDGAEAYFENAMGTRFELVVDEVISKQLFKAHTAELLEGGDYKLVIKSRAGDAAGPLQTATKRVKYLKVIDPAPTVDHAYSDGDGSEDNWAIGATDGFLNGENLAGATVTVEVKKSGETDWQPCEATVRETSVKLIRLTLAQSGGGMMAEKLRFTVTTPGGSAVKVLESFT